MKTLTIQIGNSDDKLTQKEWSQFVKEIKYLLSCFATETYFFGGAATYDSWQNVCWVIGCGENTDFEKLKWELKQIREKYKQDSVAVTWGSTDFI